MERSSNKTIGFRWVLYRRISHTPRMKNNECKLDMELRPCDTAIINRSLGGNHMLIYMQIDQRIETSIGWPGDAHYHPLLKISNFCTPTFQSLFMSIEPLFIGRLAAVLRSWIVLYNQHRIKGCAVSSNECRRLHFKTHALDNITDMVATLCS